ncbi:hypothetical protein F4679DRAFT_114478 [Xylaria curta]|nr:hypothetical protein F4679DRAFT_114478 [Xylaria curta]
MRCAVPFLHPVLPIVRGKHHSRCLLTVKSCCKANANTSQKLRAGGLPTKTTQQKAKGGLTDKELNCDSRLTIHYVLASSTNPVYCIHLVCNSLSWLACSRITREHCGYCGCVPASPPNARASAATAPHRGVVGCRLDGKSPTSSTTTIHHHYRVAPPPSSPVSTSQPHPRVPDSSGPEGNSSASLSCILMSPRRRLT